MAKYLQVSVSTYNLRYDLNENIETCVQETKGLYFSILNKLQLRKGYAIFEMSPSFLFDVQRCPYFSKKTGQ